MSTPVALLVAVVSAIAFGLGASALFTWTSGNSALWSMLVAVVLVVMLTILALGAVRVMTASLGW